MVRLVFRPYTRVRRTICTSVSLRASTRVSSGFAPLRHSSPSFGSRHACSHSNPSQKIWVGRRCTCKRGSRTSASLRPPASTPVDSHTCQAPWSVFQDGSNGEPTGRCHGHARAPKARLIGACCVGRPPPTVPPRASIARAPAVGKACNDQRLEPSSEQATAIPLQAETHRRPPSSASLPTFQALFDSLFKVLFIFPSRYLFAIGLSPIFSLGRNLSPD
ncbi:hypothetical protein KFK09_020369 [Dendrobium nobile]|uniref:Uncharacterized protein n=1 Tax=Dendrobium nobile TaxID=94219 RepID=A0A8T3ALP0_DENNO|nr:hypothetical protein KFK09_020369 [Dendrobium nobile]